ncbi:MAG: peptide-methionine (S)-S-oxide reductase MsrA [Rhodobacteraceae bacterium]|nr:peptide-methionine (S)-S-oxide reductase MsrA [Paracoccaceae bacterium]
MTPMRSLKTFGLAALIAVGLLAQSNGAKAAGTETLTVAGGCFWCVESDFESVKGVKEAVSGFAGGTTANPTYKQVTAGGTGHYEAVQITFDPAVISTDTLLSLFFRSIDPTDADGQFCDRGPSYRSAIFADGPAQMLTAVRENLRRGASQIKLTVGGGVASPADPLDTVQFTPEEIRAAVQAAKNWNTYVAAHVYNPDGIRQAVENGILSIEHANFIDAETLDLVDKKGAWLSVQAMVFVNTPTSVSEEVKARFAEALTGIDKMFKLINERGFKRVAFGTDVIADPNLMARQNEEFTLRAKWFKPAEVMRQATSGNAELLAMSGPRNPYPGKLGVIEKGAYADILLINGNPLEDISVLTNPDKNIALIMKDGKIYKHTLN